MMANGCWGMAPSYRVMGDADDRYLLAVGSWLLAVRDLMCYCFTTWYCFMASRCFVVMLVSRFYIPFS